MAGIPQQEALDIIDRLEPMSRGHYAGAVGYVDNLGDGQWWVAIRGLTIDDENFEAWAGAGIVADSDPLAEKEETSSKLASVLVALSGQPL
ncbi:MAG: chorismate-binding protein [Actinomycetota bacterium]